MKHTKTIVQGALLGLLTMGLTGGAGAADKEKCAGVIKAGKNDCATSMNACHSHVNQDSHPEAWIYVPKGTCEKIAGAHITNQRDPDEK
jgi:uncharacterized membrane protein